MKTTHSLRHLPSWLMLAVSLAVVSTGLAQGTSAFTYQGQLRDGSTNANGAYTMLFKLFDASGGGNQIGSGLTTSPVLANGLFSVNLDFGAGAFNGGARWLDITITAGGTTETLAPRVAVLPAPYALFATVAGTVTNGAIMNAQLAGNAVGTANIQNNAITTAQIANGAVTNQNLTANAVNATNIASGQVVKSLNGLADNVVLSAGANATLFANGNTLQLSAGIPNIQSFRNVTNATFAVPTNVTRIMVEMWSAGGGGGSGYSDGVNLYTGGGGGSGAYTMNIFTVAPGSSFSVTAPSFSAGGQSGGASSFSGNSISMTAGGGQAGANATASGHGNGGAVGAAAGGTFQAGDNGQSGAQGGIGAGVWRGSPGSITGGSFAKSGPGGGGGGGGPGSPGNNGNSGLVLIYY